MSSGKMLEHLRVLMLITQVIWRGEAWIETCAQEASVRKSRWATTGMPGACLLPEREHGASPIDHLLGQIATVLIEYLCTSRDRVEAISVKTSGP